VDALFSLFVVVAVASIGYRSYNALNARRHAVEETAANVGVVVSKRNSLSERLAQIVERYVGHERFMHLSVHTDSIRSTLDDISPRGSRLTVFSELGSTYPELKADVTYTRLMGELTTLESEVQNRIEQQNCATREYNTLRSSLPTILFASLLGFRPAHYTEPPIEVTLAVTPAAAIDSLPPPTSPSVMPTPARAVSRLHIKPK
jgi:LemA protein